MSESKVDQIVEGADKASKFSKSVSSIGKSIGSLFKGDKAKRKKEKVTGYDVYSDYRKSITINDIKALRAAITEITVNPVEYGNTLNGLRASYSNGSTPYMKEFWIYWFSDVGTFFWKSLTDDEKIAFKKLYEEMTGDINARGWYPKGTYIIPIDGSYTPPPNENGDSQNNSGMSDYDKDKNDNAKVILGFVFVIIVFVGILLLLKRFIS